LMHYHPKAALTSGQRARVQHLHRAGMSQSALARQVGVHRHTIQRWIARPDTADRTSGLRTHGRRVVTDVARDAVIAEWQAHPRHGPKRSAQDWRPRVPTANTATVWRILHAAGLTRRPPQKKTAAPPDSGRTPSGSTGYSGVASDSREPRTGGHDPSDSSANPNEVRGNPPPRRQSPECRGAAPGDWTLAPVSFGGNGYCHGRYDGARPASRATHGL